MIKTVRFSSGRHPRVLPEKTASEQRLRDRFNADMAYWRSKNEHISPAVAPQP